ncbi:MAG: endonuclease/exonuclease/phosphatase family protein [Candidatus Peribacteria bacterium]|jgi:endonuclease/exonuclease/phosphatase (EEP) superfamily protein YafD|nr:endonuclease/exonuclease/phosphatase family protein [Candidatus Peribacteria bacterium]
MRVYYANILYTNYDYESLKKQIEANNPHVVVLVEFSSQHEEALKDWFQERFPYVNRNSWSTKLAGDVVFSKYPITDLLTQYPQELGRWRYSYFSLPKWEEKDFYFYVVHTSAPVSVYNFNMRNEQLKKLSEEFLIQAKDRPEDAPVVMVGDFNISPWSAFYKPFEEGLEGKLRNAFKDYTHRFTWSLWAQEILTAHIDHIFVSDDVRIGDFFVEDLPGSDHHAIIFNVESKKYWKKLMDEMEEMFNSIR